LCAEVLAGKLNWLPRRRGRQRGPWNRWEPRKESSIFAAPGTEAECRTTGRRKKVSNVFPIGASKRKTGEGERQEAPAQKIWVSGRETSAKRLNRTLGGSVSRTWPFARGVRTRQTDSSHDKVTEKTRKVTLNASWSNKPSPIQKQQDEERGDKTGKRTQQKRGG